MASSSAGVAGRWVPVATSSVTRSGGVGISSRMARSMGTRGWARVGSHTEMATVAPSGTRSASGGPASGARSARTIASSSDVTGAGKRGRMTVVRSSAAAWEREVEPGLSVVEWDPHGFRVFSPDASLPLRHSLRRGGRSPDPRPAACRSGHWPPSSPRPTRGTSTRSSRAAVSRRSPQPPRGRTPPVDSGWRTRSCWRPWCVLPKIWCIGLNYRAHAADLDAKTTANARRVHAAERLYHRPGRHRPPAPGVAAGHRRGRAGDRAGPVGAGHRPRRRAGPRWAPTRWRWT